MTASAPWVMQSEWFGPLFVLWWRDALITIHTSLLSFVIGPIKSYPNMRL
jgi:hypothetical protein